MRKGILLVGVFLFAAVLIQGQTPFVCDGRFYITLVRGFTTGLVEVDIDPNTEEVEFVTIDDNLNTVVNGIGYRAQDNFIYGVHPGDFHLYRIDRFGSLEVLANLPLSEGFLYLGADITEDGKYLVLVGSTDVEGFQLDRQLVLVDLEDPDYSIEIRPITGANVNMLDIAFDPTDQTLYGFDSHENRLVTLTLDGVVTADFAPTPILDIAGSLFFDIFGNLFAYGSPNDQLQNTLYSVNRAEGTFQILTTGDEASSTDACSCPHSVELQKSVTPRVSIPCGIVRYTFAISNQSERPHSDVIFQDMLPDGFTITDILSNPFGGTVMSGVGENLLQVTGMTIPPGIDSMIIEVSLDSLPAGTYKNQAQLFGLPVGLGETRISDDPKTLPKRDSTKLVIEPLGFRTLDVDTVVCRGEVLTLDASPFGVSFIWDDQSTSTVREIVSPGLYTVQAQSLCDTVEVVYDVTESSVQVDVSPSLYEIEIGDTLQLLANILPGETQTDIIWTSQGAGSLSCLDCVDPEAYPLDDVIYTVQVTNAQGCVDSAQIEVRVDRSTNIYVPNVFSPNGDGINDVFFLQGKGILEISSFAIYDRWGGQVYGFSGRPANDDASGWNGTIGDQKAPAAVYVWIAEIHYLDGTYEIISGDVTLVR